MQQMSPMLEARIAQQKTIENSNQNKNTQYVDLSEKSDTVEFTTNKIKNKKIAKIAAVAGIVLAAIGGFALAKRGFFGQTLKKYANNLFNGLTKKAPTIANNEPQETRGLVRKFISNGSEIKDVRFDKGKAILKDGSGFTGIVEKGKWSVHYQDGFITKSTKDGKVFKTYEDMGKTIRQFDDMGNEVFCKYDSFAGWRKKQDFIKDTVTATYKDPKTGDMTIAKLSKPPYNGGSEIIDELKTISTDKNGKRIVKKAYFDDSIPANKYYKGTLVYDTGNGKKLYYSPIFSFTKYAGMNTDSIEQARRPIRIEEDLGNGVTRFVNFVAFKEDINKEIKNINSINFASCGYKTPKGNVVLGYNPIDDYNVCADITDLSGKQKIFDRFDVFDFASQENEVKYEYTDKQKSLLREFLEKFIPTKENQKLLEVPYAQIQYSRDSYLSNKSIDDILDPKHEKQLWMSEENLKAVLDFLKQYNL